jgi:V/A-type H+/Na+-transporting ATPase subunit F
MKIAIMGSPDTIIGLKAVGVEPHGIKTQEEGIEKIQKFKKNDEYGIVLITEDWATKLDEELQSLESRPLPAVIRIPSSGASTGAGLKSLKRIVERAVGSDILN